MSDSTLVSYTGLSPNFSARTGKIDRITIHHAAGVGTAERIGANFTAGRGASANYGIGNDGSVGLYVPERYRAWTSSSAANDNRAVTIEVSNSEARYPWPVSRAAYDALIALCADVCLRNGIARLEFTGDASGNLTAHRWFAATQCPGDWLYARFPQIAAEVNAILQASSPSGGGGSGNGEEVERMARYNSLAALPDWARGTVKKLCDRGIVRGGGGETDAEGYPADLDLSEDMARLLVWNDRAGVYGN